MPASTRPPVAVIALMAVLPFTRSVFPREAAAYESGGVTHTLLLEERHTIDVKHVLKLLRNTFVEVVLATRERGGEWRLSHASLPDRTQKLPLKGGPGGEGMVHSLRKSLGGVHPPSRSWSTNAGMRVREQFDDFSLSSAHAGHSDGARGAVFPPRRISGGLLSDETIEALLRSALVNARAGQARYVFGGVALGLAFLVGTFCLYLVDLNMNQLSGGAADEHDSEWALIRTDIASVLGTVGLVVTALALQPTQEFLRIVRAVSLALCAAHSAFVCAWLVAIGGYSSEELGGYSPDERSLLWESAVFNATRVLCVGWLLRSLLLTWSNVRALMAALVQTLGAGTLCEAIVVLMRRALINELLVGARGQDVATVTILRTAIKLAIGLPLLWPHAHHSVRAFCSRCAQARAQRAMSAVPLAPLLGFGSRHEVEVGALLSDVRSVFFGAPIDHDSLKKIRAAKPSRRARDDGSVADAIHGRSAKKAANKQPPRAEPRPRAEQLPSASSRTKLTAPGTERPTRRSARTWRESNASVSQAAQSGWDSYARRALIRAVGTHASNGPNDLRMHTAAAAAMAAMTNRLGSCDDTEPDGEVDFYVCAHRPPLLAHATLARCLPPLRLPAPTGTRP